MATLIIVGVGLVGIALLAGAVARVVWQRRLSQRAVRVAGTVIALQTVASSGEGGGLTYRPVVRYVASHGGQVEFTSRVGYNPPRHRPGAGVVVEVDPNRPDKPRVAGYGTVFVPTFLFGFAILVLGGAVIAFLVTH
ncbi:MAG: DUF3592 domain-containing protein [Actinomycetota bacterium]|nr:DUF3592 domain-containing protein [Actinomycetota bacterium]